MEFYIEQPYVLSLGVLGQQHVNPVRAGWREVLGGAASQERKLGRHQLQRSANRRRLERHAAVDTWLFLIVGAVRVSGEIHQVRRQLVGLLVSFANERMRLDPAIGEELTQPRKVERVYVTPRRIRSAAGTACGSSDTNILFVWHADQNVS